MRADIVGMALAVLLVFGALGFRLGHLPLVQPDEGRNAEVAREMKASGAWLVPTYNGADYLDKPAFYFKAVALSLACFGDSETAARLPSALFGLGLVGLTFAFCRRVHGPRCALLAAVVVASTPLFFTNARTVIFDIALACFTCGAIFAGFLAEEAAEAPRRGWYRLGAAATGLATLVKGPVGFLIPVLVLLIFHRVQGRRGVARRMFAPVNLLIFFGLTLPWFIGVCLVHPDFLHYGLVEESFHRYTTKQFHRSEPFYFYAVIVAGMFFPWSLLLPEAAVATWKQRWAKHPADRLCLVWAIVVVLFFSISQSKLPGYILSVTVASGLLVARFFATALENPEGVAARLIRRALLVLGIFCLALAFAGVAGLARTSALAKPLRIPVEQAQRLGDGFVPALWVLAGVGCAALLARNRSNLRLAFVCFAALPVLLVQSSMGALDVVFDAKSARPMVARMPVLPPSTELVFWNTFPNGLPFYLGRTGTLITTEGAELTSNYIPYYLRSGQPWPRTLVPAANFETWFAGRKTAVYLIVEKPLLAKLDELAAARGAKVEQLSARHFGVLLPAPGGS